MSGIYNPSVVCCMRSKKELFSFFLFSNELCRNHTNKDGTKNSVCPEAHWGCEFSTRLHYFTNMHAVCIQQWICVLRKVSKSRFRRFFNGKKRTVKPVRQTAARNDEIQWIKSVFEMKNIFKKILQIDYGCFCRLAFVFFFFNNLMSLMQTEKEKEQVKGRRVRTVRIQWTTI